MAYLYGGKLSEVTFDDVPLSSLMALFGRFDHLLLTPFDVKKRLTQKQST